MNTDNIFGNDILNGDLNTSLVPEIGQEDISLNITPSESSFADPLNQELSLTESEVVIREIDIDDNLVSRNTSSSNNIAVANIDSLVAANPAKFQVNEIDVNDTSFAPPQSQLEFQGGFGDVDGGNDVTLEIKGTDDSVIETFKLTGEGQASLYRDEEYQYVFFSGTDETTNVDIDSTSNIKFGNYIGDSLKIETTGSIEGGDIVLNEPDETGLSLISKPGATEYTITDLGEGRYRTQFLNSGEVFGSDKLSDDYYVLDNGEKTYIDSIQDIPLVVENFSPIFFRDTRDNFVLTSEGLFNEWGSLPEGEYPFSKATPGIALDVNSLGQVVGEARDPRSSSARNVAVILNKEKANYLDLDLGKSAATSINDSGLIAGIVTTSFARDRVFIAGEGKKTVILENLPGNPGKITGVDINNSGQIIGTINHRKTNEQGFFYDGEKMIPIGILPGVTKYRSTADAINNKGQVVGNALVFNEDDQLILETPYLYENGKTVDLQTVIPTDSGWFLRYSLDINDDGQIIVVGNAYGLNRPHALLLDPAPSTNTGENISIGNISTFGDTVLLQGNEIILTGKAIATRGGEITFDGATTVNNNLTVNSSVTENEVITDGGDITFTNTIDAAGSGSQNLTFKAGTGNILFGETVGGEAAFLDLAVDGAGTVTINNDLSVDGNLSLEVIDDITTTANLSVTGLVDISLGKVGDEIYSSTGNVTTGNIDANGLEVLNNGNFIAENLTTTDGDINIISLNQLNVGQLSANNGAVDLISGTAGINVSGTVKADNGFIALAQQDIVTNETTSSQDAVILKSSQGAVTVNGLVTAFGDASLAAAGDVTVGAVTSNNESVALISATGVINLAGAVSSMEDVTVASAQSLTIDQEIKAELGSIALASTEGSVTASLPIDTAIGVNIAAKQNVSTRRIRTYGGDVVVDAEQGTATVRGLVNSRGGDISISALGRVRTKNLISRSGDISVISDNSLVRTGYIRTDRGNRSGDVYLEAARNIKVAAAVEVDGEQYSIYAGEDGVLSVAYQQNKKANKRGQFVIGDITRSGTLALVTSPVTTPTVTPPLGGGVQPNPTLIYIEIFRRILDAGGTAPRHQSEINSITGQPYADEVEFELVEQLTPEQERRFREILSNEAILEEERLRRDDFRRGIVDDNGCYFLVIGRQLGNYEEHDLYAYEVTGDRSDHLVMTSGGNYSFYDGKLNTGGLAYNKRGQSLNSYAEVKTQHSYFKKAIDGDLSDMTRYERREYLKMKRQIDIGNLVANNCNFQFFLSFDNKQAANAIGSIFGNRYPKMNVHHIKGFGF